MSEEKTDDFFPVCQFLLGNYATPYRLDCDSNGAGILVFIREDILSAKLVLSEAGFEGFFIELNLRKSKL